MQLRNPVSEVQTLSFPYHKERVWVNAKDSSDNLASEEQMLGVSEVGVLAMVMVAARDKKNSNSATCDNK